MYTGLGKLSIQSEKWRSGVVMFLNVKFCYEIQHFCLKVTSFPTHRWGCKSGFNLVLFMLTYSVDFRL
ncbi:hypothetical protein MiTa_01139 [Microcystis aeruginosa NIES-4264]|nr:hypothetical protein MiTa_01139 [Microcystis aeruginosa NIES-4264]